MAPKKSNPLQEVGMTEEQANEIWEALKCATVEIQEGRASELRFEELYRYAYSLVLHKYADKMVNGVKDTFEKKLKTVALDVAGITDELLLFNINSVWDQHKDTITMIRDILMYYDKTYCKVAKKANVYDTGLILFKDVVILNQAILSRLRSEILAFVEKERNGEKIDRVMLKNCNLMLVEVTSSEEKNTKSCYECVFETPFLNETRVFYIRESQQFIGENTVSDYLRKFEIRLTEEDSRADNYLDSSSKKKLRETLYDVLITQYAQMLVENEGTGLSSLIVINNIDDLARFYRIFSLVKHVDDGVVLPIQHMRNHISNMIKSAGIALCDDELNKKSPIKFVAQMLELRAKYINIIEKAFDGDVSFHRVEKEAFEYIANRDTNTARSLALYANDMLKSGFKTISDKEVQESLDGIITLFRYLQDKDVFEEFYKQNLSRRLLASRISDEYERSMVSRLKAEVGTQYTSKMEKMFVDMASSADLISQYRAHVSNSPINHHIQLNVNVLTQGTWPIEQPKSTPRMPANVEAEKKNFVQFYTNMVSGRRICWIETEGTADIRCRFGSNYKELNVHTLQMPILALYNNRNSYTFAEIREITHIEDDLDRFVLSLAHPRIKVLLKRPATSAIADDHTFTWNEKYTNHMYKVKIPLFSSSRSKVSHTEEIPSSILENRKLIVDASIVRIMKSRRTLDHNGLFSQVIKQLQPRFVPQVALIKKRIESLIEREYLERDADNRNMIRYLA